MWESVHAIIRRKKKKTGGLKGPCEMPDTQRNDQTSYSISTEPSCSKGGKVPVSSALPFLEAYLEVLACMFFLKEKVKREGLTHRAPDHPEDLH
jgi:hypothetical protein